MRDLLVVLPAPGSSPRVVSISPICAEYAETHIPYMHTHTHARTHTCAQYTERTVEGHLCCRVSLSQRGSKDRLMLVSDETQTSTCSPHASALDQSLSCHI